MMYHTEAQTWYKVLAEVFSGGDTEQGIQECRHGVITDRAWDDTGDPWATNDSSMGTERNTDWKLNKAAFKGSKENKEVVSNVCKRQHI